MVSIGWFEGLLNTVADHGRELIGLKDATNSKDFTDSRLCHRLLEGKGEASNIAIAREVLQRWSHKSDDEKLVFLQLLLQEFDLDTNAIEQAAKAYRNDDPTSLRRLIKLTEAPRQELFRRFNMAPNGTAVLVDIRSFLLNSLSQYPELKSVDADFQHLLGSWFNRGFLRLKRIDWNSSASVLEKLIQYEAVHPINGWDDLRRRLRSDRRIFAFFHPVLPHVPLIFVEVALTCEISDSIAGLIDPESEINRTQEPDTAIFYSINNALMGLRGVSFGNFLIKQVAEELKREFPQINVFSTLSPIPMMRKAVQSFFNDKNNSYAEDVKTKFIDDLGKLLDQDSATEITLDRVEDIIKKDASQLEVLCLYYLTELKRNDRALDPVAHFHLSNGANLERINIDANTSQRGIDEAWGCMVNYRYENSYVVANHEAYVCDGTIALSKNMQRKYKQLLSKLN